ncbi:receptor-like protein 2 [Helianthus annuus]|uniref:receptor-like protein 2 n=1 Tax=Helianthus annuus TaxID=4232 RepID=UPI001652DC45|nr:receptor-like protein 2 [Helianthus annuus]
MKFAGIDQNLNTCLGLIILRLNSLGGRLSDFDFSGFSQLTKVDLAVNQFSGVLPKSLFSCKSLTAIRLARNKLVGEISPDILELPSLSFLSLARNTFKNLSQALNILSRHEKLTTLLLSYNFFNETLPAVGISGFQDLKVMDLAGCRLFGQIPIWLMSLTNLEFIALSDNNISGKIPGWLQYLPNLFYLALNNNLLSGGLPVELTRLPALATHQVLDQVKNDNFELPVIIVPLNASNWQYNCPASIPPMLDLSYNNLSGDIPVEIGNMKSIQALYLSNNYFSGTIPSSISNLTNLEELELSHNLLSGEIPTSLTILNFLSSFNVAYNNLQDQLTKQGFVINVSGDTCKIVPMFETLNDLNALPMSTNNEEGIIREMELEKTFTVEKNEMLENYKSVHMNAYHEELDQDSKQNLDAKNEVVGQNNFVTFTDCEFHRFFR